MFFYLVPIAFLVPAILKFFFNKEIKPIEWILHTVVSIIIAIAIPFALVHIAGYDTQILNGYVTEKERVYNPKEESYSCNPHTVTDSKGHSSTSYDTCYRTIPEWDYVVRSNVGSIKIARMDIHGKRTPERFVQVVIGEPFAKESTFLNYLKLSETTVFKEMVDENNIYNDKIPEYPEVDDYYKINRVINFENTISMNNLNNKLNEYLKENGSTYQMNVISIFVGEDVTEDFFYALRAKWIGGKKNDIVTIVQMDNNGSVGWTKVMSRADTEVFNKSLEMDLQKEKVLSDDKYLSILDENLKTRYKRLDFEKEYSFLESDFNPSWLQIGCCILSLIFGSILVMLGYKMYEARQNRFRY